MSTMVNMTLKDKLELLVEECAEIIQAVSKIRRFGANSEYKGRTNIQHLEQEMGDALCAMKLLMSDMPITMAGLARAQASKRAKLMQIYGGALMSKK